MHKQILAKSSGVTLYDHSVAVSVNSVKALEKIFSPEIFKQKKEIIRISGLLHDIGKNTEIFQKKLKKEISEKKNKFLHNEIGWAFLFEYLNVSENDLNLIIEAIYWHHGIINRIGGNYSEDILETVSDTDIELMKKMVIELLGSEYLLDEPRSENFYTKKSTPIYYHINPEINTINHMVRTCLLLGDRITSIIEEKNTTFEFEYNLRLLKSDNFDIDSYGGELTTRFNHQLEISQKINNTTIVKAPAGFGKTLLGLLWNKKSSFKLIWVSPRNAVTKSTYTGIVKELTKLGLEHIKVECYYKGATQDKNYVGDCEPDILVTNIDHFISPTVDHKHSDSAFLIDSADVVFDEYHELLTESGLFSSFINIMNVRNLLTNSNTLLLSATPTIMEYLWDNPLNPKTNILPSFGSHYEAVHSKKYKVKFVDEFIVDTQNSLVIVNSISNAQNSMGKYNCDEIIHSKFTDGDIDNKLEKLFITNGVSSNVNHVGNTISTLIVQASLDISFKHLYEVVFSPESTLQRMGRCNRWGEFDDSTITFCRPTTMSELRVVSLLYNKDLCNMWYDFLQENIQDEVTLDEMYVLYNNFNEINKKVIKKYIKNKHQTSLTYLSKIYPIKHFNDPIIGGKKNMKSNSNKFRCTTNQIFYICKIRGTNDFSEPMTAQIYGDITTEFKEDSNTLSKIKISMKNIRNSLDERFDYNEMINLKNNLTMDIVRKNAMISDTPYIRYDVVYDQKYGVIKIK